MRFYLLRSDGTWSDAADYPEAPIEREEGVWMEGFPDSETPMFQAKSLITRLREIVQTLDEDLQVEFGPVTSSAEMQIRNGAIGVAKKTIQRAYDTASPERQPTLEPIILALLGEFPDA